MDPASKSWGDLNWSPWTPFDRAVDEQLIPATPGIYRFRTGGEATLLYIGIGANRRRRLHTLWRWSRKGSAAFRLRPGEKRPFRGHYAAPALARCEEAGCRIEVSWSAEAISDKQKREDVEAGLISRHSQDAGFVPPWQGGADGLGTYLAGRNAPAGDDPAPETAADREARWDDLRLEMVSQAEAPAPERPRRAP